MSAAGYPWPEPVRAGVLFRSGLERAPAGSGPARGRTPVLAVGSNASPRVLQRKLGRALDAGLPVQPALVEGLGVGHSAHVSAGGYVAAAPCRAPGRSSPVTVLWCDERQLRLLDATEPNYHRRCLPPGLHWRLAEGGQAAPQVYVSAHGVVADEGRALPLGPQRVVLRWLAARLPDPGGVGLDDDPESTHSRWAADATLRDRVRALLPACGLVAPSGLVPSA